MTWAPIGLNLIDLADDKKVVPSTMPTLGPDHLPQLFHLLHRRTSTGTPPAIRVPDTVILESAPTGGVPGAVPGPGAPRVWYFTSIKEGGRILRKSAARATDDELVRRWSLRCLDHAAGPCATLWWPDQDMRGVEPEGYLKARRLDRDDDAPLGCPTHPPASRGEPLLGSAGTVGAGPPGTLMPVTALRYLSCEELDAMLSRDWPPSRGVLQRWVPPPAGAEPYEVVYRAQWTAGGVPSRDGSDGGGGGQSRGRSDGVPQLDLERRTCRLPLPGLDLTAERFARPEARLPGTSGGGWSDDDEGEGGGCRKEPRWDGKSAYERAEYPKGWTAGSAPDKSSGRGLVGGTTTSKLRRTGAVEGAIAGDAPEGGGRQGGGPGGLAAARPPPPSGPRAVADRDARLVTWGGPPGSSRLDRPASSTREYVLCRRACEAVASHVSEVFTGAWRVARMTLYLKIGPGGIAMAAARATDGADVGAPRASRMSTPGDGLGGGGRSFERQASCGAMADWAPYLLACTRLEVAGGAGRASAPDRPLSLRSAPLVALARRAAPGAAGHGLLACCRCGDLFPLSDHTPGGVDLGSLIDEYEGRVAAGEADAGRRRWLLAQLPPAVARAAPALSRKAYLAGRGGPAVRSRRGAACSGCGRAVSSFRARWLEEAAARQSRVDRERARERVARREDEERRKYEALRRAERERREDAEIEAALAGTRLAEPGGGVEEGKESTSAVLRMGVETRPAEATSGPGLSDRPGVFIPSGKPPERALVSLAAAPPAYWGALSARRRLTASEQRAIADRLSKHPEWRPPELPPMREWLVPRVGEPSTLNPTGPDDRSSRAEGESPSERSSNLIADHQASAKKGGGSPMRNSSRASKSAALRATYGAIEGASMRASQRSSRAEGIRPPPQGDRLVARGRMSETGTPAHRRASMVQRLASSMIEEGVEVPTSPGRP